MSHPALPFTPESLRALAALKEAEYEALSLEFPAGTFHAGRNDARQLRDEALMCAQWMEAKGIESLMHVGPFMSAPFVHERPTWRVLRGRKIRVRAGATIRSLHPSKGGTIITERARVVTLNDVYSGYVDVSGIHRRTLDSERETLIKSVRQPEVVWAGANGYWCHADLNDVELIPLPQLVPSVDTAANAASAETNTVE